LSRPIEIAPSVLSADFARLGEQLAEIAPYAGRIHADVMDGHFVPNISFGPVVVASIRQATDLPIEVHLMIDSPHDYVQPFVDAGADRIIFHVESTQDAPELAAYIKGCGVSAGVALSPQTPFSDVSDLLDVVDLVIVMTVNPGFGGQGFLHEMLTKVADARHAVTERSLAVDIEVDGGISPETLLPALGAGANVFAAGHAIFRAPSISQAAHQMAELAGALRRQH